MQASRFLVLSTFLLPAFSMAEEAPTDKNAPYPPEWVQCEKQTDCTVIRGYCEWVPVNQRFANDMGAHIRKKFQLDRREYVCSSAFKNMAEPAAACSFENRCVNVPKK